MRPQSTIRSQSWNLARGLRSWPNQPRLKQRYPFFHRFNPIKYVKMLPIFWASSAAQLIDSVAVRCLG